MQDPPIPWLLVAVPREHRAYGRGEITEVRRKPTSAWHCIVGDTRYMFAETGVGGAMVRKTLDWLRAYELPPFVFMAGFAGALVEDLDVGDGVHVGAVVGPDGVRREATLPLDLPYRVGTLVTSDRMIGEPNEKRKLAETHHAIVVDMETSYVASWCEERGVPWGCVRVVSDDVRTPLSKDVFDLLENGRVSLWRLTKAICRRPSIIDELLKLRRATNKAADEIASALRDVIGWRLPPD